MAHPPAQLAQPLHSSKDNSCIFPRKHDLVWECCRNISGYGLPWGPSFEPKSCDMCVTGLELNAHFAQNAAQHLDRNFANYTWGVLKSEAIWPNMRPPFGPKSGNLDVRRIRLYAIAPTMRPTLRPKVMQFSCEVYQFLYLCPSALPRKQKCYSWRT